MNDFHSGLNHFGEKKRQLEWIRLDEERIYKPPGRLDRGQRRMFAVRAWSGDGAGPLET